MKKEDIEYLALEGGGGKGVAYLGAIVALEDLGVLPISKKMNQTKVNAEEKSVTLVKRNRQIRGISGSSAGAITGLCLAMGMNSNELVNVLTEKTIVWGEYQNIYNSFFDYPFESRNYREINKSKKVVSRGSIVKNYKSQENIIYYSRVINDTDGSTQEEHFNATERKIFEDQGVVTNIIKGIIKNNIEITNEIVGAMFGFPRLKTVSGVRDDFKFDIHLKGLVNMGGLFPGMIPRDFIRYLLEKNIRNIEDFDKKVTEYNNTMWIKNNQEDMDFFNLHEEELKNPSDTLKREIRAINSKYFYSYIRKSELYNLTFEQFYFLTGVDFVVTGTNVTNHASLYFSKERTPDFPVADAVVISMNLPGIYPPVWNKAKVFQDQSQFYLRRKKIFEKKDNNNYEYRAYNKMYRGQYIDGGVMNNLPLHAFDHIEKKREEVIDTNIFKYYIDPRNPIRNTRFNNNVMGLRLTEVKRSRDGVVDKEDDFGLSILGKTLFAALYYSEDGKILSRTEKRACVDLLTYQLSTTNFAPKRGQVKTAVQEAYTSAYRFITKIRKSAPNRLSSMIEKWDE